MSELRAYPVRVASRHRSATRRPAWLTPFPVAVTTVMLALIAISSLNVFLPDAGPAGPGQVARDWLAAQAHGDAASIWARVTVDARTLPPEAGPGLIDRAALAAMLGVPENRHPAPERVQILSSTVRGGTARLDVSYTSAGVVTARSIQLRQLGDGGWKVVVVPALLVLGVPAGATGLSVDGVPVASSPVQPQPLPVLPGFHQVAAPAAGPFTAASQLVDAGDPFPALTPATLAPMLTAPASISASTTVGGALQPCLAATAARPEGCPQAADLPAGTPVGWSLVGDPAAGLHVSPGDGGAYIASGHYQMVAAYPVHVPEGTAHIAVGGAFRLALRWDGQAFSGDGSAPVAAAGASVLPAARPPLPDLVLDAAVRHGFEACAAATLLRPPDCPNGLPSTLFITAVRWQLEGDPLAGSVATFDGDRSLFVVSGSYSMTVGYRAGTSPAAGASSGPYRAELFWDGARPVLVTIARQPG